MGKFKVGDKVRVVAGRDRLHAISIDINISNRHGVISNVQPKRKLPYWVKIEGVTWCLTAKDLKLVVETPPQTSKDTNPKDALGIKKAPLSTLPTGPMYEVALAMLEGARKYGRHNYRVMGVKASVYYDAAMGHLTAWWEGEEIDPESGLHHLAKAMASIAVIRDSMMMENWIDDRPPCYPNSSKLMRRHPAVADILERYPDCVEPFTQVSVDRTKNDRKQV